MLTIGLAQLKSAFLDKTANVERAISVIQQCREKQVDYILFPELFLTGFSIREQVKNLAEPLEGDSIGLISAAAKENGVGVIMGFPEKNEEAYYNSAVFIEKNGCIRGVYRKIHLFDWEKEVFTPGREAPVFQTEKARIALMMTFDSGFPEMARIYALKGTEIIMMLTAHEVPHHLHHRTLLRARALENQLFMAIANKIGLEDSSVFVGESAFISPYGDYLNKLEHSEKIVIESIDVSLVSKARELLPMKYLENRNLEFYKQEGLC